MKDIIYREDAINIMQDKVFRNPTDEFWGAVQALSELPSAERTGKWIDTGSGQECSECHEIQYGYDNFRYFCAFCGARMEE